MVLLTLWIHGVFSVVKLGSHFWAKPDASVHPQRTLKAGVLLDLTATLPTWVCQNLFGLGDVNELLLSFLLFLWILEVVWVPLLSQLPVRSDNLFLLGRPGALR